MKRKPTITIELTADELWLLERALESDPSKAKRVDRIYAKIAQCRFQLEGAENAK